MRYGPSGVGVRRAPLQPIADGIKDFFKEEVVPENADRAVFILAPIISISVAVMLLAVIPFGAPITILGKRIDLYLANPSIGILFILGFATIGSYGTILGGWSSGNRVRLYMGGLRASAMIISYELSMAFAVISIIMVTGSFSLVDMVSAQNSRVEYPAGAGCFPCLFHRGHCRIQPHSLRYARGRIRALLRVQHRVQQHEVFALLSWPNIRTCS